MRIGVIQYQPKHLKLDENVELFFSFHENVNADIIIYPELCLTGYIFNSVDELSKVAISVESEQFSAIVERVHRKNSTVVFGFAEKSGNSYFNSAAIIIPGNDKPYIYRKTHLFYKEHFVFNIGDTGFFVVDDKKNKCRIGTMICYDWRFPESARALSLKGADLIVCPSNLVTDLWHKVMPARAIENKVYLAAANRTGKEKAGNDELLFKGESGIWDYTGKVLAKASSDNDEILYADLFPDKTRDKSFNEFNDIFKDRRPELYE